MKFYKFRYDKDNYLLIKLRYSAQSLYENRGSLSFEMMPVTEFDNMYRSVKSLYKNISLRLVNKHMGFYIDLYYDNYEHKKYFEAKRIYEYLNTEYDEEKINSFVLQEKELKKKEREKKICVMEEEKYKKKQEREEKRLRKIEEEQKRKQRQAELAPIRAKEQEIYTREWKNRLNEFLNSVMDGTYNPPETKYGYIGFGVDNISSAYKEHCMFGGYIDYESERM